MGGSRKASAHSVTAGTIRLSREGTFPAAVSVKDRCLAVIGPRAALARARPLRLVVTAPPCWSVSTR
jgi:hypothetical protein